MDPKDLVKMWDAPDLSVLTPKQMSIRLPILVAAKLSALCEIYPRKSRTEVIGDLLATALDQMAEALPSAKGAEIGPDPYEDEMMYEDAGVKGRFWRLTEKFLRELEAEAKVKQPMVVPQPMVCEPLRGKS